MKETVGIGSAWVHGARCTVVFDFWLYLYSITCLWETMYMMLLDTQRGPYFLELASRARGGVGPPPREAASSPSPACAILAKSGYLGGAR